MKATSTVTDPGTFLALEDLEMIGRGLADAVWLGRHGSIIKGSGVEFQTHREYQQGDDLRRINWSVYGRQRKLYLKESRQESQRPLYLILDGSASMKVSHGQHSKATYAARLAAGAAFVSVRQGDAPSLTLLEKGNIGQALPPRTGGGHLSAICTTLARWDCHDGPGDTLKGLGKARDLCRSRGFVLYLSDFLEDEEGQLKILNEVRAQGHDVLAVQILDPFEADLPESGDFEFIDSESGERIKTSVESERADYKKRVDEWRQGLAQICGQSGILWESVTTDEAMVPVLRRLLSRAT
ncbi:DUF58 domain-containing protein [Verrucomicrobiaceae bacterium 227]